MTKLTSRGTLLGIVLLLLAIASSTLVFKLRAKHTEASPSTSQIAQ